VRWERLVPREVGSLPEGTRLEYNGHHGYVIATAADVVDVLYDSGKILQLQPDYVVLTGCVRRAS
jgi:hypothetical protein